MADAGARDAEVETAIAARARALRAARGLTLDGLAARSGVSRAMLSRIERGESSPTAGLLVRLCDGLGVALTALIGDPVGVDGPLLRRADQPVWRDPGSGYLRRAVSPAGSVSRVEIAEVEMPAGAAVVLEAPERAARDQHLWVLDGRLEVACGDGVLSLAAGDCLLLLPAGGPTGLRNAGPGDARCAVITNRPADAARVG